MTVIAKQFSYEAIVKNGIQRDHYKIPSKLNVPRTDTGTAELPVLIIPSNCGGFL